MTRSVSGNADIHQDLVRRLFDAIALTYESEGPQIFTNCGRRLVDLAQLTDGARVLDIATGRGAVLCEAAARAGRDGRAVGIDLSAAMVRAAASESARRSLTNTSLCPMDAERLAVADASFSHVLCGFGLTYLARPERALAEMRRVLTPGGRVALSVWGERDRRWAWLDDLVRPYLPAMPPLNSALHQPAALLNLLHDADFADIHVTVEAHDLVYRDAEQRWRSIWIYYPPTILARMPPPERSHLRARFMAAARAHEQADGLHQLRRVLFASGVVPHA